VKRVLLAVVLFAGCFTAVYGYVETRRERRYLEFVEQGERALTRGDTFAAIESFSGAVALRPDSMLGYLRRGESYRRRNELESALRDLLRASQLDPTAPRPLELLGDVNAALLRYDRAAARYEAYLNIDDQSPRVLYKLALARYRAGQALAGIEALRRAIALNDRLAEAHYLLGLCLRDIRKNDAALAELRRAIQLAPALLPAREELAELYGRLGRAEDRLTELGALAALEPSASRAVALGLAYARSDQIDRAVPTLREAAARYPDDPYVYVALGRVWLEAAQARGDRVALGKALEALEGAVGTDDSSEAMTLFGRALLLASDEELAERVLLDATGKLPVDPLAFLYLAEAAERRGHPDAARKALFDFRTLQGEERDSREAAAMAARIADLSMRMQDAAAAITWYQHAIERIGPEVSLLARLAEAQWTSGDREAAKGTIARALEKDPENAALRTLQRKLR
jgi:tetratricopeptide (TPR) repeat protein